MLTKFEVQNKLWEECFLEINVICEEMLKKQTLILKI